MDNAIRFNIYFKYWKLIDKKYPYKKTDDQMIKLYNKLKEWDIKAEKLPSNILNQLKLSQDVEEDWNW